MNKNSHGKAKQFFLQTTILLFVFSLANSEVIWYGDPNKPLTESFRQLNTQQGETGSAVVVNDPVYGKVWKVTAPRGSRRAEFARTATRAGVGYTIKEGDRVFVGWRAKVEVPSNNKPDCGFCIFQLKSQGNAQQNHPVDLDYNVARGLLKIEGIYEDGSTSNYKSRQFSFGQHPMKEGEWMTFVLGFKFSRKPASAKVGFLEAWINGVKQDLFFKTSNNTNNQKQTYFRTHDDGLMYFKWGAYSPCITSHEIHVYMGDMRVGTTLESVMKFLEGDVPPPPPQAYKITTSVTGKGTIAKTPKKTEYEAGTEVTLTATPETGMVFKGWSGDATGTTNPLKVTMDQNRTVNALFTKPLPSGIEKLSIVASEASAEQNDDHLKEFSYDGNPETRWANDNTTENNWIIYDLGDSKLVNAVKLMLNVGETRTYPLKIEVGNSKDNFNEVWSGDLPPTIGLNTIVFTEAAGRYVRVSMTGPNSDESLWFSIFQAEVWGSVPDVSVRKTANRSTLAPGVNPVQGGFVVTAAGASAKLEVFNLQGKLLYQKNGRFENSFIPFRANGAYFVRLSSAESVVNRKVVIQN